MIFTTIVQPANNFRVLVLLWFNCEDSARQYNSTILFGRSGVKAVYDCHTEGVGSAWATWSIDNPGRILFILKASEENLITLSPYKVTAQSWHLQDLNNSSSSTIVRDCISNAGFLEAVLVTNLIDGRCLLSEHVPVLLV